MCRDYGASSNVSKIQDPRQDPGSSIEHPAFSWRRQGACSGKHLRWAHKVDRALRPVRRGGSSMVNQSPRTARGAFFATRVLNFSSVPLTLSCLVEVWPRKVLDMLSSNALGDRVPPLHERQLRFMDMSPPSIFFAKSRSGEPAIFRSLISFCL